MNKTIRDTFLLTPEPFKGQNLNLGAPVDWDEEVDGECGSLPVYSSHKDARFSKEGCNRFVSSWKLTRLQRLLILVTGRVQLTVTAHAMPPVALTCYPETAHLSGAEREEVEDASGVVVGLVVWAPEIAKEVLIGDTSRRKTKPRKATVFEFLFAHFAKLLYPTYEP